MVDSAFGNPKVLLNANLKEKRIVAFLSGIIRHTWIKADVARLAPLFRDQKVAGSMNLSSFVQSRNTQNDERKRFLEPEVATLPRTAPRQPPLQRLGLGRLSGKCYNELSTGSVSACLIPIAVGGPATAFSRRSVKTGGNRNASSGSTPSFSESSIVHAA